VTFLATQPKLSERQFMAEVQKYAKVMGWRWYHTYRSERSEAGFPDLVLIRRPRVVFAEIKAQRTPVTDAQRAWLEELRACGQEAYLWRPSDIEKLARILR
jgi:hypothetical protein